MALFAECVAHVDERKLGFAVKKELSFPCAAEYECVEKNVFFKIFQLSNDIFLNYGSNNGIVEECTCTELEEFIKALEYFLEFASTVPSKIDMDMAANIENTLNREMLANTANKLEALATFDTQEAISEVVHNVVQNKCNTACDMPKLIPGTALTCTLKIMIWH